MARTTFKNDMTITGALAVTGAATITGALVSKRTIGAATAAAGAATLAATAGKITTEALTTAQNGIYTLTITNTAIAAADIVMASVNNGTNTQGTPIIGRVTPAAGSLVITVINQHASAQALNGTLVVSFVATTAA